MDTMIKDYFLEIEKENIEKPQIYIIIIFSIFIGFSLQCDFSINLNSQHVHMFH